MTQQLDMFATPLPPASAPATRRSAPPPSLLPRRPIAWERLLASATHTDVTILVMVRHWTGIVIETLSDPIIGTRHLHADGTIPDLGSAEPPYGRVVFMTVEQATALHRRWPLIKLGRHGTHAARFELAPTADPVDTDTMAVLAQLDEAPP